MNSALSGDQLRSLLDDLAGHVDSRLNGHIRGFRVDHDNGGLVLRGTARTFHAKQLAQEYVMEFTDVPIAVNAIDVQ
jgi:osmotically-inducible protein OsmY